MEAKDKVSKLRSIEDLSKYCLFSDGSSPRYFNGDCSDAVGTYAELDECFVGLYKQDEKLFVAIDSKEYSINELKMSHEKIGFKRLLIVKYRDDVILNCEYRLKASIKDAIIDFFSYNDFGISEEDFDYGLFLTNVINNKEKQLVLLYPERSN